MKKELIKLKELLNHENLCWQTKESLIQLIRLYDSFSENNFKNKIISNIDILNKNDEKFLDSWIEKFYFHFFEKNYIKKIINQNYIIIFYTNFVSIHFINDLELDLDLILNELNEIKIYSIQVYYRNSDITDICNEDKSLNFNKKFFEKNNCLNLNHLKFINTFNKNNLKLIIFLK